MSRQKGTEKKSQGEPRREKEKERSDEKNETVKRRWAREKKG